ncbi:MAG: putative DNA binding domain-containing protein [Planctomycetaceae bacterium]|jgi:ATP-dependent DNA helicase RecG|nr:putative DNA binding domain-containing protein [Planctomycetaceae bacterium]
MINKLNQLLQTPFETEIIEFKRASLDFDFKKLGRYFSALSNEACLKKCQSAWLIFGVEDATHQIVGTNYRTNPQYLQSLKHEIADRTTNRITFIEIHEINTPQGRVILFEIPAASSGIPTAFDGHYYARDGESLCPLNIDEIERIRTSINDWSKEIISNATLDDLDSEAIQTARNNFQVRNSGIETEINKWDDITFLNKAKVTIKGKITRTAIILLGKAESEHFLSPATAKIRWILKNGLGKDRDFHIETCPLLLAVDKIYTKIRNIKYRYIPIGGKTLSPQEVDTYEPFAIREALNNCIAHQDYRFGTFINVIEMDDQLIFSNRGRFLPESPEKVVLQNAPEEYYRNPFLATAMYNLKMIETRGGGIRQIFEYQRDRFFPMPEYDLTQDRVQVTITGKVLDLNYAQMLAQNPNLSLADIILLDKVQKKKFLSSEEEKYLHTKKLIEGRRPNYHISKEIAQKADQKPEYTKLRGLDIKYYCDLLLEALKQHESLTREEINRLLSSKLPEVLNKKQKIRKIGNLLTKMKEKKLIKKTGWSKSIKWHLFNELSNNNIDTTNESF